MVIHHRLWVGLSLIVLLWSASLVVGCGLLGNSEDRFPSLGEIRAAETRWEEQGIASYVIEVEVETARPRRVRVTVRSGEIEEATVRWWQAGREAWSSPEPTDETRAAPFTGPGLFRTLRRQIDAGQRREIGVRFHERYGYPESIFLGPAHRGDRPVVGTEAEIVVRDFRVLGKEGS